MTSLNSDGPNPHWWVEAIIALIKLIAVLLLIRLLSRI